MLLDATGHHAHVGRSADHHTAQAATQCKQSIRKLLVEALLYLQPLCIDSQKLHEGILWDWLGARGSAVSEVCIALEGENVMLTLRREGQHDLFNVCRA